MKKTVLAVPVALLAAAALAGCAGGTAASSSSSSRPSAGKSDLAIVATTTQVADFTRNVVGDLAQVTQLIQPNASAHSFDPTAAELLAISQADVIVESGAGLETWLSKVTEAAGFKGTLVDSSQGVELGGDGDHDHDHGDDADHADDHDDADHADADGHTENESGQEESKNPHIWMDPANAIIMVTNIADALADKDPTNAAGFKKNAETYNAKLKKLDEWIADSVDQVPADKRLMVSNHDAFYYYTQAFDIDFVGSIIPNFEDNAEPSAAQIQDLIDNIKKLGVKAIFSESAIDPKAAEQVAKSAGVTVYSGEDALYADSLGPAGSTGDTYIKAQIHNTTVILSAWGAQPLTLPSDIQS